MHGQAVQDTFLINQVWGVLVGRNEPQVLVPVVGSL